MLFTYINRFRVIIVVIIFLTQLIGTGFSSQAEDSFLYYQGKTLNPEPQVSSISTLSQVDSVENQDDGSLRFTFSGATLEENKITITGAGWGQYPQANVRFGEIPTDNGYGDATDGTGMIIEADPGEGVMVFFPAVPTDQTAILRCSVRTDSSESSVYLASIDQGPSVFVSTLTPNNGEYFLNRWKRVSDFFLPPSSGFQPVLQILNTSKEFSLTVYIDNFDIRPLDSNLFYSGDLIDGDENDPALISLSQENVSAATILNPTRNGFSGATAEENQLSVMGGGFGALPLAQVSFGEVPIDQSFPDATDGKGVVVKANPGESALFLLSPVESEKSAMLRCSVRTDSPEASIVLASVDQGFYSFVSTITPNNGQYFFNRWNRISDFALSPIASFQPLIQIVNTSKTNPLTVYLDNFDIYTLDSNFYYNSQFLDGDTNDPSIICASFKSAVVTQTIGVDGGEVRTPEGAYIVIPANTFTQDMDVSIQYIPQSDARLEVIDVGLSNNLEIYGGIRVSVKTHGSAKMNAVSYSSPTIPQQNINLIQLGLPLEHSFSTSTIPFVSFLSPDLDDDEILDTLYQGVCVPTNGVLASEPIPLQSGIFLGMGIANGVLVSGMVEDSLIPSIISTSNGLGVKSLVLEGCNFMIPALLPIDEEYTLFIFAESINELLSNLQSENLPFSLVMAEVVRIGIAESRMAINDPALSKHIIYPKKDIDQITSKEYSCEEINDIMSKTIEKFLKDILKSITNLWIENLIRNKGTIIADPDIFTNSYCDKGTLIIDGTSLLNQNNLIDGLRKIASMSLDLAVGKISISTIFGIPSPTSGFLASDYKPEFNYKIGSIVLTYDNEDVISINNDINNISVDSSNPTVKLSFETVQTGSTRVSGKMHSIGIFGKVTLACSLKKKKCPDPKPINEILSLINPGLDSKLRYYDLKPSNQIIVKDKDETIRGWCYSKNDIILGYLSAKGQIIPKELTLGESESGEITIDGRSLFKSDFPLDRVQLEELNFPLIGNKNISGIKIFINKAEGDFLFNDTEIAKTDDYHFELTNEYPQKTIPVHALKEGGAEVRTWLRNFTITIDIIYSNESESCVSHVDNISLNNGNLIDYFGESSIIITSVPKLVVDGNGIDSTFTGKLRRYQFHIPEDKAPDGYSYFYADLLSDFKTGWVNTYYGPINNNAMFDNVNIPHLSKDLIFPYYDEKLNKQIEILKLNKNMDYALEIDFQENFPNVPKDYKYNISVKSYPYVDLVLGKDSNIYVDVSKDEKYSLWVSYKTCYSVFSCNVRNSGNKKSDAFQVNFFIQPSGATDINGLQPFGSTISCTPLDPGQEIFVTTEIITVYEEFYGVPFIIYPSDFNAFVLLDSSDQVKEIHEIIEPDNLKANYFKAGFKHPYY